MFMFNYGHKSDILIPEAFQLQNYPVNDINIFHYNNQIKQLYCKNCKVGQPATFQS
jgi:hypothetical protein